MKRKQSRRNERRKRGRGYKDGEKVTEKRESVTGDKEEKD